MNLIKLTNEISELISQYMAFIQKYHFTERDRYTLMLYIRNRFRGKTY